MPRFSRFSKVTRFKYSINILRDAISIWYRKIESRDKISRSAKNKLCTYDVGPDTGHDEHRKDQGTNSEKSHNFANIVNCVPRWRPLLTGASTWVVASACPHPNVGTDNLNITKLHMNLLRQFVDHVFITDLLHQQPFVGAVPNSLHLMVLSFVGAVLNSNPLFGAVPSSPHLLVLSFVGAVLNSTHLLVLCQAASLCWCGAEQPPFVGAVLSSLHLLVLCQAASICWCGAE